MVDLDLEVHTGVRVAFAHALVDELPRPQRPPQQARARLTSGQDAELTYSANIIKVGKTRRVVVESLGDEVRVREGSKCRALRRSQALTLPRGVVYTRAEGAGVLLLAAGAAGATGVAVGLVRHGVHIGSVDGMLRTSGKRRALCGSSDG